MERNDFAFDTASIDPLQAAIPRAFQLEDRVNLNCSESDTITLQEDDVKTVSTNTAANTSKRRGMAMHRYEQSYWMPSAHSHHLSDVLRHTERTSTVYNSSNYTTHTNMTNATTISDSISLTEYEATYENQHAIRIIDSHRPRTTFEEIDDINALVPGDWSLVETYHSPEDPRGALCFFQCDMRFYDVESYANHFITTHLNGEEPDGDIECINCERNFIGDLRTFLEHVFDEFDGASSAPILDCSSPALTRYNFAGYATDAESSASD